MIRKWFKHAAALLALVASVWAPSAQAQIPLPVSSQFDITGFLQEATLNPANVNVAGLLRGGTLQVNGKTIIVPDNLLVLLPANQLSWAQLFDQAPAPYGPTQTGMALNDSPAPLASYEVHVVGNRVEKAGGTVDYIAGLIDISQQGLNSGAGYINFIDYANGEMRVGGILFDATTGARVRINDPVGRYGRINSPDPRFTVDSENPTIRSETGYPMGLPAVTADPNLTHVDPVSGLPVPNTDDPLRPQTNRPRFGNTSFPFTVFPLAGGAPLTQWTMRDPNVPATPLDALGNGDATDPHLEAPFEVGDYVTFAGTLVKDGAAPTAGPMPADPQNTYISAHTITASLSILTAGGTDPAYVAVDVTILGVGGVTAIGLGEATARTKFEGFSTDPSRIVTLWGMDVNCSTGAVTDRDWGSIGVDPGAPTGAVAGRWRWRSGKGAIGSSAGAFLPATRMMRAVVSGGWTPAGGNPVQGNGLIYGQYQSPILEYLFPENVPGAPLPANNLETFPFLARGSGPLAGVVGTPVVVGQLFPWPGNPIPLGCGGVPVLHPPLAVATPATLTVVGGTVVTLDGNASIEPNGQAITGYLWEQPAGQGIGLSTTTASVTSFTAPIVPFGGASVTLTFTLKVTSAGGTSAPATSTITVTAPAAAGTPVANAGAAQTVPSGTATVTLNGSASSDPLGNTLHYTWTQIGGNAVALTGANTALPTFTAPTIPAGSQQTFTFRLVVDNGINASLPANTTVTVVGPAAANPTAIANATPNPAPSDAIVTLNGSSSSDPKGLALTYLWEQTGGTPLVPFASTTSPVTTIAAPHVGPSSAAITLTFRLTVRNSAGLTAATTFNVVVNPAALLAPVVTVGASQTVASGALTVLSATAADPNIPAQTPLAITWTQTQGPVVALAGANGLTPSFQAPIIPAGQAASVLVFRLDVVNKNGAGLKTSAIATVVVNPQADGVTITAVEYRSGKQRLTVNVTDTVTTGTLPVLTLKGQLTWTDTVMQNLGGGLYQVVLVGVPLPPSVTVSSSLGGAATMQQANFRIRQ